MLPYKKSLAAAVLLTLAKAASAASYSGMYVFGDSLSDTGNAAAIVGTDPSQVMLGNGYVPRQPYASGQFTNGDVWVKPFSQALGLAAYSQPSLAGGSNFSFGGARTATDGAGLSPSVSSQANLFLSAVSNVAPSQALYVVGAGGNDARDMLASAATSATPAAVIAAGATAYANAVGQVVDRLQAAGAQHIVVWDVPNLGLAPAVTSLGPGASLLGSQVSAAMNGALSARMGTEVGVSIFDLYGLQSAISANPGAYGLSNITDACGSVSNCDPATSVYWDGIHPTEAVHSLISQGMLQAIAPAVPEPTTWTLMAGGLAVIGWLAQRRRKTKTG